MNAKMKTFLKSLILGLVGKPLESAEREPVAYLYSGVMLPKLPEWDRIAYPYAMITHYPFWTTAYAFSEPITAELTTNLSGNPVYAIKIPSSPFLMCELALDGWGKPLDENGKEEWNAWREATETESFYLSDNYWINHDIIATDNVKAYFACDTPMPVYLPCILYEGEELMEYEDWDDSPESAATTINVALGFENGDILRVTINGVSSERVVEKVATSGTWQAGNAGLNGNDLDAPDDGGDWLIVFVNQVAYSRIAYFYTRNEGTYRLKIELVARAKK